MIDALQTIENELSLLVKQISLRLKIQKCKQGHCPGPVMPTEIPNASSAGHVPAEYLNSLLGSHRLPKTDGDGTMMAGL